MSLTLSERYLSLPPVPAWPALAGSRFLLSHMTDLDGDGRQELPVFVKAPLSQHMGLLAYYNAGEIAPEWAAVAGEQIIGAAMYDGEPNHWSPGPNDFVLSGKVSGTQKDDLLVLHDGKLHLLRWGSTQQAEDLPVTRLHTYWSSTGTIPGSGSCGPWTLTDATRFALADFDGDGLDELLCYDGSGTIGLAKWSGSALTMQHTFSGALTSPSGTSYTLQAPFHIHAADLDGDGAAELVGLSDTAIIVLRWNAPAPQLLGVTSNYIEPANAKAGRWMLLAGDSISFADIDGNGALELVIKSDKYLGAAQWDGQHFQMLGGNFNILTNAHGDTWLLLPGQQVRHATLNAGQGQSLVMLQQGDLGIFDWQESEAAFSLSYAGHTLSSPPKAAHAASWTIQLDTQLSIGDVDGDGRDELLLQSGTANSVVLARWFKSTSPSSRSTLSITSLFQTDQPGKHRLPSWGIGMVANAPSTAFAMFLGIDLEVYQKLSNSLTEGHCSDIRSQYTNGESAIASYAASLQAASPEAEDWAWMAQYSSPELKPIRDRVMRMIDVELYAATSLYAMDSKTQSLTAEMQTQRTLDLDRVNGNLANVNPDATSLPYWAGALLEAALVGLAAFPFGEGLVALNIGIAAASSLFGSLLGAVSQSSPEVPINYAALSDQILQEAQTANKASSNQLVALLADPVKLRLMQPLLLTSFAWKVGTNEKVAQASAPFNRLRLYQQLVPQLYTLWVWQESINPKPQYHEQNGWVEFDPPSYCTWKRFQYKQYTQIEVLAPADSYLGAGVYPSQQLIDDLFGTSTNQVGIPLYPVLDNVSDVLPIPQTNQQVGPPPLLGIIYVTNSSGQAITVEASTWGGVFPLTSADVAPGQTTTLTQAAILWGSHYELKATPGGATRDFRLADYWAAEYAGGSWTILGE